MTPRFLESDSVRHTPFASSIKHRPASRRLHRRAVQGGGAGAHWTPSNPSETTQFWTPRAVRGLSTDALREAGMLELIAAEQRIAELEAELAAARVAATTDPLTGTLNRRGFETVGQGELARARRKGQELALAHLDLDGFKQINDAYGHAVGDLALQHLVRCLQDGMRPGDVLCRLGGEEFVLLLSETGLDEAVRVLQRHLATLGDRPVPGTRCYLSFSAGVVGVLADETLDAAVQRADAATYVAKRAGRQRVERA